MKSRRLPFAAFRTLLLPAITLAFHGFSSADTFTWTNGDTTGMWSSTSTTTDWKSATVPNAAGTVVRYSLTPTANAAGTVTLDQAATIGIITQLTNSGGGNNGVFKIEKSGTNALTFDNTGGITNTWGTAASSIEFTGNGNTTDQLQVNPDIIIANTDLNIATISCGVRIGSSANNSAITATNNRSLILRGNAGTRALTINHSIGTAGAGTITLSNIGSAGGVVTTIAGNLGAQVGSITQNGANTLVLSGTNSAFTGPTTITTGPIRYAAATALPAVGSGRSITVGTGGIAAAGYAIDNTFLGRIVQSSTGAIALHVASANALDFSGFSSASLAATAAVTYSGALTPNAQAYRFGGGSAILTVSSNLGDSGGASSVTKVGGDTVTLGGTNTYTNGTAVSAGILKFTNPAALPEYTTANKISVAGGATLAINYGGSNDWKSPDVDDLLTNNGAGFAAGSALGFDTTNSSLDYPTDITITNLGVTKLGNNVLTLGGTNTHTGVTTISSGTLEVETIGNGGVAGNLGQATNAAANLVINGGTLRYIGATAGTDRNFTLTTASGAIDASGTGALTWNGTATLTGTNTARTFTLTGTNTDSNTFASILGNNGTGATSLLKSGAGKWVLSQANTYGGTTTISAGTLTIANGGSFTTTVANATSLVVGNASGNSLLQIQSGGAGTASRLQIGTANGAVGAFHNQGTLTVNGTANLGNFAVGFATGAYGYYRHDNANTTAANEMGIASSGNSTDGSGGNGVVDVLQGTLRSNQWFSMNRSNREQYSQLNISGGNFDLPNSATQVGLFMNNNDTQNGKGGHAVINLSGTGSLTSAGTTTELDLMRISQPTTATTMLGVLNIGNGGTVQTNRIKATQTNGTALVNFHGGTLKANNTGVVLLGGSNIDGAYVYSGGANLNTNGKDVTVSQALLAPTGGGVSSIPVTANGTGYTGRPIVYLTGGDGSGATAVANFNPATGEVTGVTITNPGTGYTTVPTVTFSGGGGSEPTLGTVTLAANTSGGLTKSGTGTLSLTAANSYTGDTTVSEGTLSLGDATNNTSLADTAKVFIASGATLNLNYPVGNTDTVKELWIGGVQKTAGVYSSSDLSGQITGTGTLTVTTGPATAGYSAWQSANSATGQTVDQDHDYDGVDNGIEYFLGGNAVTTGFTTLPAPVAGAVTWTKAAAYTGTFGTDFKIQSSTDLNTWTDAATSGSSGVPGTVFLSGSDYVYTLPTGAGKTFVRLLVNPN